MKFVLAAIAGSFALLGATGCADARETDQPGAGDPMVTPITSPTGAGAAEPFLAVGPDGTVFLSWLEPVDSSSHALRFAAYDGTQWSAPTTIRAGNDFFVNWADFPSIRVLDDGRLAAHWLQKTGSGTYAYGVRVSQSMDGGAKWSAPIIPHRDSSDTEHGFVTLWGEGNGIGAVWLDGRKYDKEGHSPSNEMMVVSTTISPAGEVGAETRLDERACDCCQTAVAVTSRGPIVAYRDRTTDEIRRWVRLSSAHPRKHSTLGSPASLRVEGPRGVLDLPLSPTSAHDVRLKINETRQKPDVFALQALGFTRRHCEVCYWLMAGKRDREIATILGCSGRTIAGYVATLLRRTGASNRQAAVHVLGQWLRNRDTNAGSK